MRAILAALLILFAGAAAAAEAPAPTFPTNEGDFVIRNFKFRSGERLPELRLHYMTLGTPKRDARGRVTNAIMILHGTGGTGQQFLRPQFANVLFVPGGVLDPAKYFIILPDGIGHGKSSKPSDGLRARFPKYDYDDMVAAQHALLTHLGVRRARLIMGTSMGCMHSFVWGEMYPDFMDALMPLACLPVEIAGRNRMWRKLAMDAIANDPAYQGGNYTTQPTGGLRTAASLLLLAGQAPIVLQKDHPTREAADKFTEEAIARQLAPLDANDLWYQINASRNYNPEPRLETIRAPVMWINSADDFINPPELGIAERMAARLRKGRLIVLPASGNTRGHGSHTWAVLWQEHLKRLLEESERR
jgi:homoserine O-acetyltransferase/O-succinyltransferase